ncbi:MAG: TetR family transcriptional regulator [Acidimicrobiia bacterium]
MSSTQNVGLTREQIVDTALTIMDAHGVDAFSMRRLADALGVRAPTLYWHFADKQTLQDACVQQVLDTLTPPAATATKWEPGVRSLMHSVREQLAQHPSVIALMGRAAPPAFGHVAAEGVRLMRAAGLDWPDAFLFCRLMFWRIVGFTSMELGMQVSNVVTRSTKRQPHTNRPTRFESLETFPVDAPPRELARATKVDIDEMYEADIDVFVAGLRSRARSTRAARRG